MNYDCEKFIDSYIESFNRTSKSQDEKRGLALPKMEDIETLEEELMAQQADKRRDIPHGKRHKTTL